MNWIRRPLFSVAETFLINKLQQQSYVYYNIIGNYVVEGNKSECQSYLHKIIHGLVYNYSLITLDTDTVSSDLTN